MKSHTCEWCGTTYPDFDKTETYMGIIVFGKLHIICLSCYENITEIEDFEGQSK